MKFVVCRSLNCQTPLRSSVLVATGCQPAGASKSLVAPKTQVLPRGELRRLEKLVKIGAAWIVKLLQQFIEPVLIPQRQADGERRSIRRRPTGVKCATTAGT